MGRTPRDRNAGVFHVYTHCVYASTALYRDDLDRLTYLRHLARVTGNELWTCMTYCLMGTHNHLIVAVEDEMLSRAMHSLNLGYARDFNRRHGLKGHVQFAPYGARRIHSDASLLTRFRYVVRNPVRAGLCARPEEWPWSSYAGTAGLGDRTTFVDDRRIVALFADPQELQEFVEDS